MVPTVYHCRVFKVDWADWLRVNRDLPANLAYDTWSERLRQFCQDVAEQGGRAVEVDVKPAEFLAWCQGTGRQVGSNARAAYAATLGVELEKRNG